MYTPQSFTHINSSSDVFKDLRALSRTDKDLRASSSVRAGIPLQERIAYAEGVTERLLDLYDEPQTLVLDGLSDFILLDELRDMNIHKMKHVEYPFMSERQFDRRTSRESATDYIENKKASGDMLGDDADMFGYFNKRRANVLDPDVLMLHEAIENVGLTLRQRQVIYLRYFKDLTGDDCSSLLGISQQNVEIYLDAALSKLREFMVLRGADSF